MFLVWDMRVCLVRVCPETQVRLEPLSLLYLKTFLIKNNFDDVDIFQINYTESGTTNLLNKILSGNYSVVGFNVDFSNFSQTMQFISKLKEIKKGVIIVLGGYYPSLISKEIFKRYHDIDIIVRGEGEITFLELLLKIKNKLKIDKVDGIAYKRGNKIILTKPRSLIKNLDDIPIPLRGKKKYVNRNNLITAQIQSSRGCPFNCSFCSISSFYKLCKGPKWRTRSAKNVIKEIKYIYSLKKVRLINFVDDNFLVDYGRAERILKGIRDNRLKIKITFMTRPDQIIPFLDILLKYKKLIYCVDLGVESGSRSQLERFSKNFDVNKIIDVLKFLENKGINYEISNIFWDPDITLKEIRENIAFLEKIGRLQMKYVLRTLDIYPGTPYFSRLKDENLIKGTDFFPKYSFKHKDAEKLFSWTYFLNKKIKQRKLKNSILKKEFIKKTFNVDSIKTGDKNISYNSVIFKRIF